MCDGACMNLLCKTPFVNKKIYKYVKSQKEFVRRTAFTLIACLSFKKGSTKDKELTKYFELIEKYAYDERNFVKKAINWALRQIGKRNRNLNKKAIKLAEKIKKQNTKSAR
ncbi:MAG: DNA alkylation repair protein [Candidatus Paceibacterota bacterium]